MIVHPLHLYSSYGNYCVEFRDCSTKHSSGKDICNGSTAEARSKSVILGNINRPSTRACMSFYNIEKLPSFVTFYKEIDVRVKKIKIEILIPLLIEFYQYFSIHIQTVTGFSAPFITLRLWVFQAQLKFFLCFFCRKCSCSVHKIICSTLFSKFYPNSNSCLRVQDSTLCSRKCFFLSCTPLRPLGLLISQHRLNEQNETERNAKIAKAEIWSLINSAAWNSILYQTGDTVPNF